ncbi:DeoR/GlpR family DNA-binding transcription regulator [Microbacterium sp. SSW1-59]|uniref:DeoR/GlpR family DNA-binding transcription regulator n=1 Tax=Microbacterium xanthum TaxID=3079794 RepID=UPI002AD3D83F|nr:DeoR/GlpR family DNA-binding transcription regulator [Microbacterium sp. SSW1-59]MDZ8201992.1 DeoR/GlpR family DNA-binding transcription regulator [Microbacterium sp. SSW1-59]
MYATERHELIERLLTDDGRVSVVDLARRFGVTTETVRRDLAQLEGAGSLRRVHGGAVKSDRGSTVEPTLTERLGRAADAKAAIAARAITALGREFRGSVYLDAGTTTAAVAERLDASGARIEAVTHALSIAQTLSGSQEIDLTVIGGRVRGVTGAAVGAATVDAISGLRPDVAFVGTNGVSADFGLSTPDPDEASVKRQIVRSARRVIVLADAEKLGADRLVGFAALADIDVLVTDASPDPLLAAALEDAGVEVWIA